MVCCGVGWLDCCYVVVGFGVFCVCGGVGLVVVVFVFVVFFVVGFVD